MAIRLLSVIAVSILTSSCASTQSEVSAGNGLLSSSDNSNSIYRAGGGEHADWQQAGNGEFLHSADSSIGLRECRGLLRHDGQDYLSSFEGSSRLTQRDDIFPRNLLD